MVKIDVEGFEYEVISGLLSFLAHPNMAAYVEVTPEWIEELGGTADDLFSVFHQRGFRAALPLRRRNRLTLKRLERPLENTHQYDVVFMRPDEVFHSRARPLFV